MYDICCVGHITLDRIVTHSAELHMAGGTSFYFSNALRKMDVKYLLVTAIGEPESYFVHELRGNGTEVVVFPSKNTVYFENIYAEHLDQRTQRVLQEADPFNADDFQTIEARIFHLGPLLANDIPLELIQTLAQKSKVSLDVQGYLRDVIEKKVCAADWAEKKEALKYVHTLKADAAELEVLTGIKGLKEGAIEIASWGVREVVITLASLGSVIYDGKIFYEIPAFRPAVEVDATGCGDTYMAGYLYKRIKGADIQEAGEFAAAMASLKIASSGPFNGTKDDIKRFLSTYLI